MRAKGNELSIALLKLSFKSRSATNASLGAALADFNPPRLARFITILGAVMLYFRQPPVAL